MKKVITSLLVVAMAFASTTARAGNIPEGKAKAAAAYYLACNSNQPHLAANDMTLVRQIDNEELGAVALYFFNAPKSGWVILAGTTVLDPVVAFSPDGLLQANDLPANLEWWLGNYAEMVKAVQTADADSNFADSPEWSAIENGKLATSTKAQVILMQEYWDQGSTTNPTYNLYCPVVDGRTSVVGCVATALGQMCHYYRYPVQPQGYRAYGSIRMRYDTISFNYDLMPNGLEYNSTTDEIREVAKLCYAMGVAVKMNYHPDGSGANNGNVVAAMPNIFKYNQPQLVYRNGDDDTSFVGKIRRELLKRNLIYMTGASSTNPDGADAAGHAWLCAGYRDDNTNQYWMNWGWGGTRYGNGFFNLVANSMYIRSMNYNFNLHQAALIGLTPPDDSNRFIVSIREVDNTTLGSAYPNPAAVSVTLPYSLDQAADLKVYSIDGKLMSTRRIQAGNGEAVINVDNMPAGIYIYRLNSVTGKFIVR